ncbi:Regulator of nonsense transcripts 1 like protein, partial [Dictyocoela roeselum]
MINCSRCNMASNLVKCLDCSLVFCSLAKKSSATCLSHHLKTLKHKKIEIGRSMECKHCKESDVFTLGYHDENIDKISCLMCKNKENVSENNVNVVWKPLIFNESVSNWVFDDRTLNKQSVNKALFGDFFSNRLVKLVSKAFALTKPSFTKIKFTPNEYVTFFTVLLQEEFKFEVKMKEKMTQTNVHVDWYETDEEIKKCSFELNQNKNHLKIKAGDEVHLSSPEFIAKGRISDDLDLHAVDVEIFFIKGVPPDIVDEIVFPPGSVSFSRMACALERFERSCSASLFNFILTGENDGNTDHIITNDILVSTTTCDDHKHVLYPPNVPRLNYSQIVALKAALNQSLTLIQGPPGTGKTSTSATLVYNLVTKKMGKVLVVASSNAAVNNLVKQMLKANINVVHILANSRQKDNFGSHTLHQMIKARMKKELKKLKKKRSGSGCSGIQIDESYLKSIIESLRSEYENDILTSADVVACTCIISGEMILRKIEFQNVLIDEAVQCIEPATVIPLTYGCKRLILVGDHKQLGPVILN